MTVSVHLPGVVIDIGASPYQLVKLVGFTDTTDPRVESDPRENGHGDFGQSDIFQDARYITIEGEYQRQPGDDLFTAGDVLKKLHGSEFVLEINANGRAYRASVAVASRVKWDVNHAPMFVVPFELTVKADDPRWYGQTQTLTVGPPTPGVGMSDPFTDPFDEGAAGNPGRVVCINNGSAPTEPKVKIFGGMSDGFELLCLESARVVRVTRPIPDGSFVTVDHSTGEVWIDDQSLLPATYVPVSEWFQINAGETCTIQWQPLGTLTGSPRMVVEFAGASW